LAHDLVGAEQRPFRPETGNTKDLRRPPSDLYIFRTSMAFCPSTRGVCAESGVPRCLVFNGFNGFGFGEGIAPRNVSCRPVEWVGGIPSAFTFGWWIRHL